MMRLAFAFKAFLALVHKLGLGMVKVVQGP